MPSHKLTNLQQFSMVCTLITIEMTFGHSKLKWNHEPQAMQSFEHFDVISVVDKSIDHGKLLSNCFSQ